MVEDRLSKINGRPTCYSKLGNRAAIMLLSHGELLALFLASDSLNLKIQQIATSSFSPSLVI